MQAILVATPNWRGVIDIRNVSTLAVSSLRERHVCLEVPGVVLEVHILGWILVHRVCRGFEHTVLSVGVQVVDETNAMLRIFAFVSSIARRHWGSRGWAAQRWREGQLVNARESVYRHHPPNRPSWHR